MLALCIAAPKLAQPYLERLGEEHFTSPVLRKAFIWLGEHLANPIEGLDDRDPQLYNAISRLQAVEAEPPTAESLDFRWRMLELDRMDRDLRRAAESGDAAGTVELQRQRAQLKDAIASR